LIDWLLGRRWIVEAGERRRSGPSSEGGIPVCLWELVWSWDAEQRLQIIGHPP
jgi:hypothetical protein